MATKTMYRVIDVKSGKIMMSEYDFFPGRISIDSMEIEFNDVLTQEQRFELAEAMGEDVAKMEEEVKKANIEIYLRKEHIKTLSLLDYKAPPVVDAGDGELLDFDDIPF